jgi:hypothetical protein
VKVTGERKVVVAAELTVVLVDGSSAEATYGRASTTKPATATAPMRRSARERSDRFPPEVVDVAAGKQEFGSMLATTFD